MGPGTLGMPPPSLLPGGAVGSTGLGGGGAGDGPIVHVPGLLKLVASIPPLNLLKIPSDDVVAH
jgi:hypothetical protein